MSNYPFPASVPTHARRWLPDAEYPVPHEDEDEPGDEAARGEDLSEDGEPRLVQDVAPEVVAVDEDAGETHAMPKAIAFGPCSVIATRPPKVASRMAIA